MNPPVMARFSSKNAASLRLLACTVPVVIPLLIAHLMYAAGVSPGREQLVKALHSEDRRTADDALDYMRKLEYEGWSDELWFLLRHDHPRMRREAVGTIGRLKHRASIPVIAQAMEEGHVREKDALEALGTIPHPDVVPYFEAMISSDSDVDRANYLIRAIYMKNYNHTRIRFYTYSETPYNEMGLVNWTLADYLDALEGAEGLTLGGEPEP